MIIVLWFTCVILFLALAALLAGLLIKAPGRKESLQTFFNGFKDGLKGSGFHTKQHRYPVELWIWETMDDEDVCEHCLERASWPPMDIADWMKEGLPGTPESETECGPDCRCRLVRYNPKKSSRHHFKS